MRVWLPLKATFLKIHYMLCQTSIQLQCSRPTKVKIFHILAETCGMFLLTQCVVVLVGDSGSGKSSLARRQVEGNFDPDSKPTIGINLTTASAEAHSNTVKLKIWDTAGQERYRAPTNYYNGADGVMLVYDVSQRSTYDNVSRWLGEVRNHADAKVGLVLVGNKSDLAAQRATTYEEGQSFASMSLFHALAFRWSHKF